MNATSFLDAIYFRVHETGNHRIWLLKYLHSSLLMHNFEIEVDALTISSVIGDNKSNISETIDLIET